MLGVVEESQEIVVRESKDARGRAWGVQCNRIKRDGRRCGAFAIRGGTVCHKHGGQLPVVRAAANARVLALVPLAVRRLELILNDPATKPADALRAIKLVLRLNHVSDTLPQRTKGRLSSAQRALESGTPKSELDDEISALIASVSKPRELEA